MKYTITSSHDNFQIENFKHNDNFGIPGMPSQVPLRCYLFYTNNISSVFPNSWLITSSKMEWLHIIEMLK